MTRKAAKIHPSGKKTSDLEDKINQLTEDWKRALADYQNLKKRVEEEKAQYLSFANRLLIVKLLEVLDALDKASLSLKDEGVKVIYQKLFQIFESEGVKEIRIEDKFNPETMECIGTKKGEKEVVLEVVQKGYFLNGKLLRSAKVIVGK